MKDLILLRIINWEFILRVVIFWTREIGYWFDKSWSNSLFNWIYK